MASSMPFVSVIIPTHNRKESLLLTLDSLFRQTYSPYNFEVILIDDGGSDGTGEAVIGMDAPFSLRYVHQKNKGGVLARNYGAELAMGELLVFLDDDMSAHPRYLEALVCGIEDKSRFIARGRLQPWESSSSIFARSQNSQLEKPGIPEGKFSSNNFAIKKVDFFLLGGWRDLLPETEEHRGGLWADFEFAVRASRHDYNLITVDDARIVHRDYSKVSLDKACERMYMVSKLAVPALKQHPELLAYAPMFDDKGPIAWKEDPPRLIMRKAARQITSLPPMLWLLKGSVGILERIAPESKHLLSEYGWVTSTYIYRGYREGLRLVADESKT